MEVLLRQLYSRWFIRAASDTLRQPFLLELNAFIELFATIGIERIIKSVENLPHFINTSRCINEYLTRRKSNNQHSFRHKEAFPSVVIKALCLRLMRFVPVDFYGDLNRVYLETIVDNKIDDVSTA